MVHIEAIRQFHLCCQILLLRLHLVGHALLGVKPIHTRFIVHGVPAIALSSPTEVEVEQIAGSTIAIHHHSVPVPSACFIHVVAWINHWVSLNQIVINHLFPSRLRIGWFGNIHTAQIVATTECIHQVIDVATSWFSVSQPRGSTHSKTEFCHSIFVFLRTIRIVVVEHQVPLHRCTFRYRFLHWCSIVVSRSRGTQSTWIILAVVINHLRTSRCHTACHGMISVIQIRATVEIWSRLMPMACHQYWHIHLCCRGTQHGSCCTTLRLTHILTCYLSIFNDSAVVVQPSQQSRRHFLFHEIATIRISQNRRQTIVTAHNNESTILPTREYIIRWGGLHSWSHLSCFILVAHSFFHKPRLCPFCEEWSSKFLCLCQAHRICPCRYRRKQRYDTYQ